MNAAMNAVKIKIVHDPELKHKMFSGATLKLRVLYRGASPCNLFSVVIVLSHSGANFHSCGTKKGKVLISVSLVCVKSHLLGIRRQNLSTWAICKAMLQS